MKPTTGTLWWLSRIRECEGLQDATDVLLMIGLADHINSDDETIVGIHTLAFGARCSYPTAKRRLKDLETRGFILRERRRRSDGNMSTYVTRMIREAIEPEINMIPANGGPGITQMSHDQGSPRRSLTRDHPDDPAEVPSVEVPSVEVNNNAQSKLALAVQSQIESEFAEWWNLVPRKVAKPAALNSYRAARKKISVDRLFEETRRWAKESESREMEYVCHPTTWLNQERWADDPLPEKKTGRDNGKSTISALMDLMRLEGEIE